MNVKWTSIIKDKIILKQKNNMSKNPENTKDLNKWKDTIQLEIYALRDEISKASKVLDVNKRKNIEARLSRLDNLVTKELQNEWNTAQDRKDLEQLRQSISTMKLNLNNTWDNYQWESYRTYMRSIQWWSTIEQSPSEVIREQVNQTISSWSSNESTWTSALKTLWVIAAWIWIWALLYKWCKSLFWDDSESEDESEGQSEEAEESEENEESEESSEGTTWWSWDSQQEQQWEEQWDNTQQESNPELDESLEADQSLVKRFDNYMDILLWKEWHKIEHKTDYSIQFWIHLWGDSKKYIRTLHVNWAFIKWNKIFGSSYALTYNPSSKKFTYYDNNDTSTKEINNKKVREVLDNINDIINWDHSSLDKLIK